MKKRHGFGPLGAPDGEIKNKIFGQNLARLFNIDMAGVTNARMTDRDFDGLAALKADYEKNHPMPSQVRYGWVRNEAAR
jgi:hypothetical protein